MSFQSDTAKDMWRILELINGDPNTLVDKIGVGDTQAFLEEYYRILAQKQVQGIQKVLRDRGHADLHELIGPKEQRISLENGPEPQDELIKKAKKMLARELMLISKDFAKMSEDVEDRNFVSNNLETIEHEILGARAFRELYKPVVSKKHTMDIIEQMEFVEDYINGEEDKNKALDEEWIEFNGKRISMDEYIKQHVKGIQDMEDTLAEQNQVGAPRFVRDPEFRIDLNTPNGEMYSKRKYTVPEKQVAINLMNLTSLIVKNFSFLIAMLRNHRESTAIQKAERKKKVSEKQSNSA